MNMSEQWDKKHVVLDTNIIVSVLFSGKGNPGIVVDLFLTGELKLFYNDEILDDYADVLYRPHLRIPVNEADDAMVIIRQHGKKFRLCQAI